MIQKEFSLLEAINHLWNNQNVKMKKIVDEKGNKISYGLNILSIFSHFGDNDDKQIYTTTINGKSKSSSVISLKVNSNERYIIYND